MPDRTFLWVALILQPLKDRVEAGASRRELYQILESRDIYAVYRSLLQERYDALKARRMLDIILAALRPMTMEEPRVALTIRLDSDYEKPALPNTSQNLDEIEWRLVF